MAARLLDRSPSSWSCSEVKLSVAAIAFLLSQTKLAACIQSTREGNRSLGLLLLSDRQTRQGGCRDCQRQIVLGVRHALPEKAPQCDGSGKCAASDDAISKIVAALKDT